MSTKDPEIYLSVDIEADGPIPGPHSMLSLGAAAFLSDGQLLDEFTVNLEILPEAKAHPRMAEWWQKFPEAWAACRQELRTPLDAMNEFADWIESMPGKPIFVAWPATWDFMWVYWYLVKFTNRRPFSEHGIDMRSYAMGMRKRDFRHCGKNYLPKRWFSEQQHTHIALDDAKEQGALFMSMMEENLSMKAKEGKK